jgi:hypothetical protein
VVIIVSPVVSKIEDIPAMIELSSRVFKADMGLSFPLLFSEENIQNMTVIREDGRPVTMIGMLPREISIFGHRLKVGLIGAVCTHSDYRGRDYGRLTLEMSEKLAIEKEISIFVISGTRGLYSRFGAITPGGFFKLNVTSGECCDVREATEGDIERILGLYRTKPVRYIRDLSEFSRVFSTGRVMAKEAKTYLGEESYITVIKRNNRPHIVEYGGHEENVLRTARGYLQLSGESQAVMTVDRFFKGNEKTPCGFEGTMKIISIENFLKQLEGYFRETIKPEGFKALEREATKMSAEQFTRFALTEDSIAGLPVPLPDYGFDYI